MKHPPIASYALALLFVGACNRAESAAAPAASATPVVAPPARLAAVPAAVRPTPAPAPVMDPRWPQWLPPIEGIAVRMASRDFLEGSAVRMALMVLVASRRSCETAGYTLSQTDIRRTRWDTRYIFTATRAETFVRIELTEQTGRPTFTSFNASTGAFARAMMGRRAR